MEFEYDEDDLDIIKADLVKTLEEHEGPLAILALVEVAIEMAVKETGGAMEGLSLFLTTCGHAPIIAEQVEGGLGEWVH